MRDLVYYPNPVLKKPARELTLAELKTGSSNEGLNLNEVVRKMFKTMYADQGIGLAAPQINISLQIVVINLKQDDPDSEIVIYNPKLSNGKGETYQQEGCLSFPNVYPKVKRFESIILNGIDRYGKEFKEDTNGMLARVIQHEVDHCLGKLFIDYLSSVERTKIRLPLAKLENGIIRRSI